MLSYNKISRSAQRDRLRERAQTQSSDASGASEQIAIPKIKAQPEPQLVTRPTRTARNLALLWPQSPEKPKAVKYPRPSEDFYLAMLKAPTFFPKQRKLGPEPKQRVVGFDLSDSESSLARSSMSSSGSAASRCDSVCSDDHSTTGW